MRNEQGNARSLKVTLTSVMMLGAALTYGLGCGDDPVTPGTGTNPPDQGPADAGTPTDAGTSPTDAGTSDGGTPAPTFVDTDLAIVRLNADGSLDNTFGTGGVARLDLGVGSASAKDALWSAALDRSGRVLLFGSKKGSGERVDADRVIARLTPAGALDTTFGTDGYNVLNIANLSDQARHGGVDPDGKIVAAGYTGQPTGVGTQTANRIVLTRLSEEGKLDTTFGSKGVVNSAPFQPVDSLNTEWGLTEAYAARNQDGKYVTTGYGRTASTGTVDLVSFRYTADGKLDKTWGTDGSFILNVAGGDDRGRDLSVLPDGRVFMGGSTVQTTGNVDAMVVMLSRDGKPDSRFSADGWKAFDNGGSTDEAFFKTALSSDGKWLAAAGYSGSGASANKDDLLLFLAPVTAPTDGSTDPRVIKLALSSTSNERLWSVAFDSANKVYAAGFHTEGGDQRFLVMRFDLSGNRDNTFGNNGLVSVNVAVGGTEETARAVLIQPDGKIVLAGVAEK